MVVHNANRFKHMNDFAVAVGCRRRGGGYLLVFNGPELSGTYLTPVRGINIEGLPDQMPVILLPCSGWIFFV